MLWGSQAALWRCLCGEKSTVRRKVSTNALVKSTKSVSGGINMRYPQWVSLKLKIHGQKTTKTTKLLETSKQT